MSEIAELTYELAKLKKNHQNSEKQTQSLKQKQQTLIVLLNKQIENLKNVIVRMQIDIQLYQAALHNLQAKFNFSIPANLKVDNYLQLFQKQLISSAQSLNIPNGFKGSQEYIIKQVPIFVEKIVQVQKQVKIQVPIFVDVIKQVQKPIFVQKIIQIPCSICLGRQGLKA